MSDKAYQATSDDVEIAHGSFRDSDKPKTNSILRNVVATVLAASMVAIIALAVVSRETSVSVVSEKSEEEADRPTSTVSTSPNFVFIIADDLGIGGFGPNVQSDLKEAAPHLTALTENGIFLNNYYGQEVCSPSRAAMLTGKYPISLGMQYGVIQPTTSWGLNITETLLTETLSENGYQVFGVGKWHLGHFADDLLPTARGFDYFTGYMNGNNYYFSKKNPLDSLFHDFMTMDSDCYHGYNGTSLHEYSTTLYTDIAIDYINNRDESKPFFLYLSYQAVHDPFVDVKYHQAGVPIDLLQDGFYDIIESKAVGHRRRQYAMTLNVLDSEVHRFMEAIDENGVLNSTYVIIVSDNGGCYLGGGLNAPYRGTKGSLFEGGTKVDGLIYSPNLLTKESNGNVGNNYNKLMHVTDWYPTILDFAGIDYSDMAIDGVSHYSALTSSSQDDDTGTPREYLLYNSYFRVDDENFGGMTKSPFAIRNSQFKLIRTSFSSIYSEWYNDTSILTDDDNLVTIEDCSQFNANTGTLTLALFDLTNDPYETTNLYEYADMDDDKYSEYATAKSELFAQLESLLSNSMTDKYATYDANEEAYDIWKDADNYIVPVTRLTRGSDDVTVPSYCGTHDAILMP